MKISKSLITLSALTFLGAVAAASGACTASVTPGFTLPGSAVSFTGTIPVGLETACTSGDYYVWESGGPCSGVTYLLCDDATWDDYDCTNPGTGWNPITASVGDAGPTGDAQAPSDSGPASDAGPATDAPVGTEAGPTSDGGTSDAGNPTGDASAPSDGGAANDGSAATG